MAGFWFHQIWLRRLRTMGRGPRSMRARWAMMRRANRRTMQSLTARQIAVAEMEEQNRRIRGEMELISEANTVIDLLVYDSLLGVENDPLMRNAFQRINARNTLNRDRARSLPGRRRRSLSP